MVSAVFAQLAMMAFGQLVPDRLPPVSLLRDVNAGAEAVILAKIESTRMPKGGFAATTVNIQKVYRGGLRAGASLTYYSLKEVDVYPQAWLDHNVIVFLKTTNDPLGVKEWGEASELFEFEYSPALEQRVVTLIKKGRK